MNVVEALVFEKLELQHERRPGPYMLVSTAWRDRVLAERGTGLFQQVLTELPDVEVELMFGSDDEDPLQSHHVYVEVLVGCVTKRDTLYGLPVYVHHDKHESLVFHDASRTASIISKRGQIASLIDLTMAWGFQFEMCVSQASDIAFYKRYLASRLSSDKFRIEDGRMAESAIQIFQGWGYAPFACEAAFHVLRRVNC